MPETGALLAFACVTFLVLAVPGPSVVYVVGRSLERGRRAGLWSVLGLETGLFVHVCLSAVGFSAVLASTAWALELLTLAGAGYLAFLGLRQFGVRRSEADQALARRWESGTGTTATLPAVRPGVLFRDGLLVDLLNPKTCLFFLAFLPQFVDPTGARPALQLLALGLVVVPVAAVCDGAYALLAGSMRGRLLGSAKGQRRLDVSTGIVYLLLGVAALLW